ncbi:Plastid ribosomal protein L3, imported to chloroplast, large ribosomal subunit [Trebouxia sp. C0009 RCD-2024]
MTSLHSHACDMHRLHTQFASCRVFAPRQAARSQPQAHRQHAFTVQARSAEAGMGMFGTKAGMTQIFTPEGLALPATVIALEEGNVVTQVHTVDKSGYNAVQVGYQACAERKVTRPEAGHCKKAGASAMRHLREFKIPDVSGYEPGQALNVEDLFKVGDMVDVAGTSIGKGFQGTIKRWNHHRGLMTHGSKSKRQHGSIGMSATPSRVLPGLKMAGHMGAERVKIRKLEILKVRPDIGAIVVKGAVPGKPGNVLEITPAKIVGKNNGPQFIKKQKEAAGTK